MEKHTESLFFSTVQCVLKCMVDYVTWSISKYVLDILGSLLFAKKLIWENRHIVIIENIKNSSLPRSSTYNGTALYLYSLKSKIPCALERQIAFIALHEHPVFLSGYM